MRTYKTEGIVIKRRNFGEADRILTIFTRNSGKQQVKAIGVRKITSRRSPHIELLNNVSLILYKGRNMSILTEAQTIEDFSAIKNDLAKVGFAYHVCELVDGLCPENQENEKVFFLIKDMLIKLSMGENIVSVIHQFEIDLLKTLGFFPNKSVQNLNTTSFIENILEKRLKTKQILPKLV